MTGVQTCALPIYGSWQTAVWDMEWMKERMTYFLRIYLVFYLISPDSGSYVGAAVGVDNLKGIDDTLGVIIYDNFEPTGISLEQIPSELGFVLEQNYPNPFNPTTKIRWQSPVSSWQTLKVYNMLGNEIAMLVNEKKPAGSYEVSFDASGLPSGVYFYKLQAGSYVETKKMILLK